MIENRAQQTMALIDHENYNFTVRLLDYLSAPKNAYGRTVLEFHPTKGLTVFMEVLEADVRIEQGCAFIHHARLAASPLRSQNTR